VQEPLRNRALRIDYAVQRWRARRARDAGYAAEVIPYTSYGSASWIRVLARVLLAKSPQRHADTPTGIRGWRNFIGVPIENAHVTVDIGGRSHEVEADPSGIVDLVVEVDLEPGWHQIGISSEDSALESCLTLMTPSWSPHYRGRCWPPGTPSS
jgi:phosphatidate phosphatase APP1